ncbi:hypothetical protein D3C87_2026840 [compost metagenome]
MAPAAPAGASSLKLTSLTGFIVFDGSGSFIACSAATAAGTAAAPAALADGL